MFGISEIAVILIIVVLLFGAKKLPELARSAGKAARILTKEARATKTPRSSSPDQPRTRIVYPAQDHAKDNPQPPKASDNGPEDNPGR